MRRMKDRTLRFGIAVALCATGCARPFLRPGQTASPPTNASIEHRVILVGDGGAAPPLSLMPALQQSAQVPSTIVWLGDNVYPSGVPDDASESSGEYKKASDILGPQVRLAAAAGAQAIYVPGNHDWNDKAGVGSVDGLARVRAQARLLGKLSADTGARPAVRLEPKDGCPGPIALDIASRLRLIVFDSNWLLRVESGERPASGDCRHGVSGIEAPHATLGLAEFYSSLEALLEDSSGAGKVVLLLAHHPVYSYGPHDGPRAFQHLMRVPGVRFPIPLIGAVLRYGVVQSAQDFDSSSNEALRSKLLAAMSAFPPLAYVSGHDHGLQVMREGSRYFLVSGSASKKEPMGHGNRSLFSEGNHGFMCVDVMTDGSVYLTVVHFKKDGARLPDVSFRLR